jgi:hypothetical protein
MTWIADRQNCGQIGVSNVKLSTHNSAPTTLPSSHQPHQHIYSKQPRPFQNISTNILTRVLSLLQLDNSSPAIVAVLCHFILTDIDNERSQRFHFNTAGKQ